MRKRLLIAGALLVLALPVAGVLWLLYTEAGLQSVVRELDRLQSFRLKLEGVSGTLAGPLRVRRFELDHPRVHLIVHDLNADFRLSGLLLLTVNARSLTGRDVYVAVRREPKRPESERPLRFLPRFINIRARDIGFTRVHFVNLNGFTIDADRIATDRARMSSARLTLEAFEVRAPLFAARGNYEMHAQRPLRLALNAAGTLNTPRGAPLQLQAKVAGTLDELLLEAQVREPDVANVRATLTRPNDSWRIDGRMVSPSLGLEGVLTKPPFRFADVALRFEMSPQQIRTYGALTIPTIGPLLADVTGQFAAKRLTVSRAELRTLEGAARIAANGWMQFGGESPQLDARVRWSGLQWPLTGPATIRSAQGELRMSGAMPYAFTIAGALGGDRVPAATLQAHGNLGKDALQLDSYVVRTLQGALAGSGQLGFAKPQPWSLSAQATELDPSALHAQFPGRVSFSAHARGTGVTREARFDARIADLSGDLRGEPLRGGGRVERLNAGWRLHDVDVRWGGAHAAVNGLIGPNLDVQWSVRARSLRKFMPALAGQLQSTGRAAGKLKTPHVVATLSGTNVQYEDWRVGSVQLDADVDAGSDAASHLTLQAQRVGRDAPWFENVALEATGNRGAHDIALNLTGSAANGQAAPRGRMQVHGRYDNEVWALDLSSAIASDGSRELKLQEPSRAMLASDSAAIEPVCFVISTGRICAQGRWQRQGPWSGQVEVTSLPLATLLAERENAQRLGGTVSGRARASGAAGAPWVGDADLHIDDAMVQYRLADGSAEEVQLGSGALAAAASAQELAFNVDLRALENTFVRGSARLARTAAFSEMPLQGEVKARTADANLLPLLFPDIDRAAGVLEADITLGGVLGAPRINGRVSLANGELDSYRVNLALRQLQAEARLQDTGLAFNATARSGEGELRAGGNFQWRGRRIEGEWRLAGTDLLVADLPEYRVVASPDLLFTLRDREMNVTGNVRIPSARIQPVDLSGAVRVSDDARLVNEHPSERAGRLTVSSNIRIIIGDDVRLDTFGLQGQLQGEVTTLVRTAEDPLGRGELSVKEGRYEAYGQKLDITRGRLLFDNSPLDDPALDIQAERKLEEIKVGLNVRGTLRAPRLSFFSDPSMPQTQIVEYLLVGKPLDEYQNRDAQATGSASNTLALQGGGLLASQLGRRLGLEEVGVESDDNGAALVLGKFLSPRLFVSYGISLAESINTLKLRYTISDHWLLRTESGEAHAADLEFTIER